MADALKVLGQVAPAATTLTALYPVPAATSASASSLIVCNRGGSATSFRVSLAIAGAADDPAQYVYYDLTIPANETFIATVGFTLATTDVVRVYAGNGNLSFHLLGVEVT